MVIKHLFSKSGKRNKKKYIGTGVTATKSLPASFKDCNQSTTYNELQ